MNRLRGSQETTRTPYLEDSQVSIINRNLQANLFNDKNTDKVNKLFDTSLLSLTINLNSCQLHAENVSTSFTPVLVMLNATTTHFYDSYIFVLVINVLITI